jgi:SAM-dependent methyltransferase
MYEDSIRDEFTRQVDEFADARPMSAEGVLGVLVDLAPEEEGSRWIDLACGPGLVSRALARRAGSVLGVDLTPAMLERARRDAGEDGLENVSFEVGDATSLAAGEDSFDGAITRFSLHHIPAPGRVVEEMARVVRPGGWVVVGDHLTDEDGEAAAWHQEIERLRDPTHWACQTQAGMRTLGERAGLELDLERVVPLELDFEGWLVRASGAETGAPVVDRLLAERAASECFEVFEGDDGRRKLRLRYWLGRWRVP